MRTTSIVWLVIILIGVSLPLGVLGAEVPALDASFHIVPDAHDLDPSCDIGAPLSFGAVMSMVQSAIGIAIAFGILIFVMIMAWAGVLFITSATNPENRSTARKMLLNGAIGIMITLAAWLMVDFVMKTLYNPNNSGWGPWNSILGDGPVCVVATTVQPLFSGAITAGELSTLTGTGIDSGTGSGTGTGEGSCSPIPDSQLRTFEAYASHNPPRRGTIDTVQRFMRMRAAALEQGITLKAGSAYRPPEEGEELWRSHGCQVVNGRTVCSNGSLVAVPCSMGGGSNHTKGTAIDIQTNRAGIEWLRRNGAQYGFYNKIASEPWHWSDTGH